MDLATATPDAPEVAIPDATETSTPDEGSLADHEASYGSGRQARQPEPSDTEADAGADASRDRDEQGRFAPRHKAQSQKASADDVATINALTKELRQAEADLLKARPDALSASPRVRSLQRQIKAIKAELAETSAPAEPTKPSPAPRAALPVPEPASRPKPTEDEIGTKYQNYADFVEDLADWKVEQREAKRAADAASAAATQQARGRVSAYQQRTQAFAAKTPDFERVTQTFVHETWLPALLLQAIMADDNGPAYVYHLAQHPSDVDELLLLTDGKPVTDALVASVQRRLKSQHAQAATTGSAAVARPAYTPPRPPNPVRTGPIRTGEDLPGDESSLADHERTYGPKRRR